MGLLDDAIRDHLELKRLRGADPGEVAREQREALDPVLDQRATSDDEGTAEELDSADARDPAIGAASGNDDHAAVEEPAGGTDVSEVPQETAELDMRSVLDERRSAPAASDPPVASLDDDAAEEHADQDSLEWEVPGEHAERALEDTPDR
jgi:hypothetical protein